MKNRILRLALVVLAVAGQAAAGFFVFQQEQTLSASRQSLAVLVRHASRLQSLLGELRGAQAGMVATGQDAGFWVPKVGTLVQEAASSLKSVEPKGLGAQPAQDLAAATEALAAFSRTSDRVRDLLANGEPLTASSLAFGDAAQHLTTASAALASAASTQAAEFGSEVDARRRLEAYALLGAGGLTVIALLLLLPRVRRPEQDSTENTAPLSGGLGLSLTAPSSSDVDALGKSGLDLDIPRAAVPADPVPEQPHESEVEIVNDLQRESQLRLNTDAQVDLAETARLCGDLARVKEGAELPALLARVSDLLDASGIVVWIAEPETAMLRPAASHGYTAHTMSKMGALQKTAENAVSLTVRSGQMQVVRGSRDRNGAVVAPINTSSGCVGAMAAEIRHGAENSAAVQSVSAIIAAQLASLVAEATAA